jgi:mono/diheme cytochrome c family protein
MKRLSFSIALPACAILLASCEAGLRSAPPVTTAFVRAAARETANARTLEEGRKVFVNRCISCHALPAIGRYNSKRIPGIVNWMSHRAHLTRDQKDALIEYLLTARSQPLLPGR